MALKWTQYFLTVFADPPYTLVRWRMDYTRGKMLDVIQRYDPDAEQWEEKDNQFIREEVTGYGASLMMIDPPKDDRETSQLARMGWRAERFN